MFKFTRHTRTRAHTRTHTPKLEHMKLTLGHLGFFPFFPLFPRRLHLVWPRPGFLVYQLIRGYT